MSVILGAIMGVFIGVSLYALVAVEQINKFKNEAKEYRKKYIDKRVKETQIEEMLKEQDYGSIDNLKNKIRTILKEESVGNLENDN